jgi:hypothetical protein
MQFDLSSEQFQKALYPISVSLELNSNVTADRNEQQLKLESQRISTLAGMQIDLSDEQFEKALFAIRCNREPGSKPTVNKCLQCEKQKMPITSKSPHRTKFRETPKYRTGVISFDSMRKSPRAK